MSKKFHKKLKAKKESIALIPELLEKSRTAYKEGDKRLSKVYSKKIKYLTMKYKIKLPKEIKRQLCKHCEGILIPSVNCMVRINKGRLIYYCLECRMYGRMPLR